jgi:hypothetical protein
MFNRYAFAAGSAILLITCAYVSTFLPIYGFHFTTDQAIWGQFGDYIGGTLNPVLSFISVILLIRSVSLQNDANSDLRKELKHSKKTETFRSFNGLFFSMIDAQKALLRDFNIRFTENGIGTEKSGVSAIMTIEDRIHQFRRNGKDDEFISEYLKFLDKNDQIFGLVRSFYITVKIVFDKLNSQEDFTAADRQQQLLTLINFTDFAQLRLIIICMQFLDYQSINYLKSNSTFLDVLSEVKLEVGLY